MKRIILLILSTCFLFTGCDDNKEGLGGDGSSSSGNRSVVYSVSGTGADFSITYENASGGVSQQSGVASGWSTSFMGTAGQFVYVSAQNGTDAGTVTVKISVNGSVWKESTSSGAYVIATASGSLD